MQGAPTARLTTPIHSKSTSDTRLCCLLLALPAGLPEVVYGTYIFGLVL